MSLSFQKFKELRIKAVKNKICESGGGGACFEFHHLDIRDSQNSESSRPAWSTEQVQRQGYTKKPFLKNQTNKTTKKKKGKENMA